MVILKERLQLNLNQNLKEKGIINFISFFYVKIYINIIFINK